MKQLLRPFVIVAFLAVPSLMAMDAQIGEINYINRSAFFLARSFENEGKDAISLALYKSLALMYGPAAVKLSRIYRKGLLGCATNLKLSRYYIKETTEQDSRDLNQLELDFSLNIFMYTNLNREFNNEESLYYYDFLRLWEFHPTKKNHALSLSLYEALVKLNNHFALYRLHFAYEDGDLGCEGDKDKAKYYLNLAEKVYELEKECSLESDTKPKSINTQAKPKPTLNPNKKRRKKQQESERPVATKAQEEAAEKAFRELCEQEDKISAKTNNSRKAKKVKNKAANNDEKTLQDQVLPASPVENLPVKKIEPSDVKVIEQDSPGRPAIVEKKPTVTAVAKPSFNWAQAVQSNRKPSNLSKQ